MPKAILPKTSAGEPAVQYQVGVASLHAHTFSVSVHVVHPVATQRFSLPAWIPGSYMVREFARNIVQIKASAAGKKVTLKKLDKHTWQAAPCKTELLISYDVYAWDLSVRAAHLDHIRIEFDSLYLCLRQAAVAELGQCGAAQTELDDLAWLVNK